MVSIDSRNETKKASWMPCPTINTEYPGLAYIYPLDELIVVKQSDAYHDIIGEKNSTGYTIFNNLGQKVFLAVEKKRCMKCYIKIFNHYGNEVIKVKRGFKLCKMRCFVWAPQGNLVGSVKELKTCVSTYKVKHWYDLVVLKIKAQGLFNLDYDIITYDRVVGRLANNWKDRTVLGVNNFGMSFPMDMNILDKAVLVGACCFIGCLKYGKCI